MFQTIIQSLASVGTRRRSQFAVLAAILVAQLGWGSVAEARTVTLRWTHVNPTDIDGFRVYSSSTPGTSGSSLVEDLTLAEAGPNEAGEFFYSFDVADAATVHITLTAYDDEDVESFRSNERAYGPPPPPDRDNDGTPDADDAFPDDPNETTNSDDDEVGDNADAFPFDSSEWADTDEDGYGDNGDAFPNDSSEWVDSDGDGVGDNADVFPNDSSETVDSDGDTVGDNGDAFPNDSSEWADSDGDGYGDNSDFFPNDPELHEEVDVLSPYRVSAGETQDRQLSDGRTWTRDVGFWNTGVASLIDSGIAIAGTNFDEMYRSSRTDAESGEEMLWSFPLTNGPYTVDLHFAEHTFGATGQRFFDVEIEDVPVLEDFDIFAEAGNAQNRAVVKSYTVQVTDGVLEILFLHRPGGSNPTIMGIEVVSDDAMEGPVLTTPGKPFLIDVN